MEATKTITIGDTIGAEIRPLADEDNFTFSGVAGQEIDVSVDQEEAQKMVDKTGQMGVPVIIINKDGKEDVIVGFDKAQLMTILGIE